MLYFKKSVKNSLKVKRQGKKDKTLFFRLKRKAMEREFKHLTFKYF